VGFIDLPEISVLFLMDFLSFIFKPLFDLEMGIIDSFSFGSSERLASSELTSSLSNEKFVLCFSFLRLLIWSSSGFFVVRNGTFIS
jgi:hypothetical protein